MGLDLPFLMLDQHQHGDFPGECPHGIVASPTSTSIHSPPRSRYNSSGETASKPYTGNTWIKRIWKNMMKSTLLRFCIILCKKICREIILDNYTTLPRLAAKKWTKLREFHHLWTIDTGEFAIFSKHRGDMLWSCLLVIFPAWRAHDLNFISQSNGLPLPRSCLWQSQFHSHISWKFFAKQGWRTSQEGRRCICECFPAALIPKRTG